MRSLLVANWKLYPQKLADARELFDATKRAASRARNVSFVVAPPAVFLQPLSSRYGGDRISFGLQNAHWEKEGPFVGEVSLSEGKDVGASYVIVGHSARRSLGETNEETGKKVAAALALSMRPILCVGELSRMESADHFAYVRDQLRAGLEGVAPAKLSRVIIAYEPLWAVGTTETIEPRDMHEMAIFIRKVLVEKFGDVNKLTILYGGSVTASSAPSMLRDGDVHGLLVGRASIQADELVALAISMERA